MPLILMIQVFLIHLKGNIGFFFFLLCLPLISVMIAKSVFRRVNLQDLRIIKGLLRGSI